MVSLDLLKSVIGWGHHWALEHPSGDQMVRYGVWPRHKAHGTRASALNLRIRRSSRLLLGFAVTARCLSNLQSSLQLVTYIFGVLQYFSNILTSMPLSVWTCHNIRVTDSIETSTLTSSKPHNEFSSSKGREMSTFELFLVYSNIKTFRIREESNHQLT